MYFFVFLILLRSTHIYTGPIQNLKKGKKKGKKKREEKGKGEKREKSKNVRYSIFRYFYYFFLGGGE